MCSDPVSLTFRAFSDPTRRRILHLLSRQATCIGDLVEILRVPQPTVSRHLRHLRDAGLVTVLWSGRWAHYSLAAAKTKLHRALIDCLSDSPDEVPEIRKDRARAERLRRKGGCCPPGGETTAR